MAFADQKTFILESDLSAVMRRLALPAIAAMVLFGLNAFMDTVYIGQLMNEQALAGVALAYPLTGVLMGMGSWAGTGAGNLLSIALGSEDTDTQHQALPSTTVFALLSSVVVGIPGYLFAEELVAMMGGSGEVLAYGTRYLKLTMLAAPFWVYGLALNFIVRSEGKMKEAAVMMSYGLGLNILLTPIFIQYFDMGVGGAAWATNLGMVVYCLVGYRYFSSDKPSFRSNVNSLSGDRQVVRSIARLGFPGFILTVMGLIQAIVVFNAIVGVGGNIDGNLAFFAAANRIALFLMTPLFGLMRALQPTVGINYGAGQYKRVKQSFWLYTKTGLLILAPFWALLTIFPAQGLSLVLPDTTFTAADIWHFRIYILILPLLPLVFNALTFLPAIDQPKYASIVGAARQLVFYVPVMLILPRFVGLSGIYYGATAIDVVVTIWLAWILIRSMHALPEDETEVSLG
ncbi:MAG: MATE family efflux transporter [Bacteroidota bacterium]